MRYLTAHHTKTGPFAEYYVFMLSWWCNCVKVVWEGVKLGGFLLGVLVLVTSASDLQESDCTAQRPSCLLTAN